jgi:hypothetical protein
MCMLWQLMMLQNYKRADDRRELICNTLEFLSMCNSPSWGVQCDAWKYKGDTEHLCSLRFQGLMAMSMKMIDFWVIAPCSIIVEDWRFRGAYCVHHQEPMKCRSVTTILYGVISQKAIIFTFVICWQNSNL